MMTISRIFSVNFRGSKLFFSVMLVEFSASKTELKFCRTSLNYELVADAKYSPLSNTGNVLNKRNIGPLGQKLIKITHLISVTKDQFSVFE